MVFSSAASCPSYRLGLLLIPAFAEVELESCRRKNTASGARKAEWIVKCKDYFWHWRRFFLSTAMAVLKAGTFDAFAAHKTNPVALAKPSLRQTLTGDLQTNENKRFSRSN